MIYIDAHLEEPCRLDQVAEAACFSPFHFHRIFARYTGETPGRHFLRRRLEHAARRLSDSADRIIDIALEAGYDSHNAFCKAFRRWTGISPSRFRGQGLTLAGFNIFPPVERSPSLQGFTHRPRIVSLAKRHFVYVQKKGFTGGSMKETGMKAGLQVASAIHQAGIADRVCGWVSVFPRRPTGCMDAEAPIRCGALLDRRTQVDPPLKRGVVGGGKWAVFCHHGPYDFLFQTWNAAYFNRLPALGLCPRNAPPFEWYVDPFSNLPAERLITQIHIPIH